MELAWLILLIPLVTALGVAIFGRKLPEGGGWLAVGAGALTLLIAMSVAWQALQRDEVLHQSFTWFTVGEFQLQIGLYIDKLAALMLIIVSTISFLILIYSIAYMHEEGPRLPRYYAEILLFVGSMLGLVLAENYLFVYIFWELVGLCSFLLIGYWFERPLAAAASIKAFLVTRAGDLFFMAGIFLLLMNFKTLSFTDLFSLKIGPEHIGLLGIAGLCIFGGAVGKSAQFPLHIWLPDAMEGPTTVSALIHAATMVNAGVYLIARSMPLLVHTPDNLLVVAFIGGFTAFLAATMALVEHDIKRILAYSTISQLGYMFLGLGVGGFTYALAHEASGFTAGMFHLMNHAYVKALLFLGVGSVIHAVHTNDLRQMGGLSKFMPITSLTMLIGALAMAGMPPFSTFWSKDELIAAAFEAEHPLLRALGTLGLITAFLTAFYMFRLWFLAFSGKPRQKDLHAHESPSLMTVPLGILAVPATLSGFTMLFGFRQVIAYGEPHAASAGEILGHLFADPLTYLSIAVVLMGVGLAYLLYVRGWRAPAALSNFTQPWQRLLEQKYYLDTLFVNWFAGRVVLGWAWIVDQFDRVIVDGAVNGVASVMALFGRGLRRTVSGLVSDYASWVVAGLVILVIYYMLQGVRP